MKNFEKLVLAGVVAVGAAWGTAHAADLAPTYKMPVKAIAPVQTWNGFYVGGNVGYDWSTGSTGISVLSTDPALAAPLAALVAAGSFPTALSPSAKGVIGGVQAGYNWQVAPQWLVGLEADFQGADVKGTTTQALAPVGFDATSTTVSKGIDWFGTVRGRVGVLVAPQWLLYGTGGFAYGRTKSSFSTTDVTGGCIVGATICASGASSGTSTGWTAGAGTEVMFAPNWSFKAEYLYVDLGRRTLNVASSTVPAIVFTTSTPFREQIARVGVNYHFSAGPVVAKY
ncbi:MULTISPECIES: outer membrane protein [Bradyrhizobium]|jgi:outer membrane immunogenic protein|uniref:Blr4715 protein n=2 Tax=Bradyrhizobium diazoefficiens TaxID=1355477 RepID=Q89L33_BRADU|nr:MULTISPECIES: outer membrane protein [Bradyrhizobium]MBP1065188.1 outer membrane immunogenic protein [Bradyrhizobium japonicum]AND89976.1 hypothetical protein AAV28_20870 [Bradyrhizobium diazoefficiens USDA 110]APO53190.1 hypothetical protein BD122_22975 [Bradyrhizobium diazoefficiens]AWO91649.1 porin family protein [Bradyrhizobium diazoefficiens]KGJ70275.1 hypothetical protein BJA5080_07087 [Bradyrhizobium diazoefficiens SEMIA 5080]